MGLRPAAVGELYFVVHDRACSTLWIVRSQSVVCCLPQLSLLVNTHSHRVFLVWGAPRLSPTDSREVHPLSRGDKQHVTVRWRQKSWRVLLQHELERWNLIITAISDVTESWGTLKARAVRPHIRNIEAYWTIVYHLRRSVALVFEPVELCRIALA